MQVKSRDISEEIYTLLQIWLHGEINYITIQ